MGSADTVDNSSSSSLPPPAGEVNLNELAAQFKDLQEKFSLLLTAVGNVKGAPVDPAPAVGPVEPSIEPHVVTKLKVAPPDTFTGSFAKAEEFLSSLYYLICITWHVCCCFCGGCCLYQYFCLIAQP